jgi:hypothetical protein
MSKKHLKRAAHFATGTTDCWWYEDNGGIDVYMRCQSSDGMLVGVQNAKISWRSLRAALARKDKEDKQ